MKRAVAQETLQALLETGAARGFRVLRDGEVWRLELRLGAKWLPVRSRREPISYGGFTQEGLHAFGRGRKVICMSGEDIYKALGRRIPIAEVIERKVRAAAETGAAFVPLDELFKV